MSDVKSPGNLNLRALEVVEEVVARASELRAVVKDVAGGGRWIDAGVEAPGGVEAGLWLANVCLAGLADVSLVPEDPSAPGCPRVMVSTDHPVAACMASQYAGWQLSLEGFFAMGSGPMRAAYGGEELFDAIGRREAPPRVAGVLETSVTPGSGVFAEVARKCRVSTDAVTILGARTRSLAGSIQVVARSVETALHKLHTIGFPIERIESAVGWAPLPPPARKDLEALGRTNDAILYGAQVTLYVRGDGADVEALGPSVPSSSSPDYGAPFLEVFERCGRDFYKMDPHLFSPAEVRFQGLDTGRARAFGRLEPSLLARSFFG